MKISLLIFCLILTGCGDTGMQRAKQEYACRNEGGVYIYVNSIIYKAKCRSGRLVDTGGISILPEEYRPIKGQIK